jgi:uncharacterized protein YcfL
VNRTLLLLALLLPLGAGCASNTANRVTLVPEGTAEITVTNGGLQGDCEIVSARALYEDEILMGVVELKSHIAPKLTLEGRFTWYDSDGIQQEEKAWMEVFVNGLEEKQVQGRAPEPGAVRGVFELRRFSGRTDADN